MPVKPRLTAAQLPRRWPRRVAVVLLALLIVVAIATAGIGWLFSDALLDPDHSIDYDDTARGLRGGTVTLERDTATERDGLFGLDWKGGHAIQGRVVTRDGDRVVRRVARVRGTLREGTKVYVDPDVYERDPRSALRIPFARVDVPTRLGAMPAWLVPGRGPTWVVFVHGRNATRRAGLRYLPALRRAGLPVLLISYRNDPGAPRGPGGLYHLGATEWQDLEAAVALAQRRGARRIVLMGLSMGGAIVCEFVRRSERARAVTRLVLDAPALDWDAIVSFQARRRHLPGVLGEVVESIAGWRIDASLSDLDQVAHARDFRVPILLFHGTEDETVPISSSEAFARALPRLVSFHRVRGAGHVEAWNVDRAGYERALLSFLRRGSR